MKKEIFSSLFILLTLNIYAQFDYREGFVILNNNDTIYGVIDFKKETISSREVTFKHDLNTEPIKYTPDQIKAYHFLNGKYYVSKHVELSEKSKQVFLEILLRGNLNLYYAVLTDNDLVDIDQSRKGRYFVEKDGKLVEIDNDEKIIINKYGGDYIKKTNQYKGVLKSFFIDSPELIKKVDYVAFNQKSLLKIAKDYHMETCPDMECIDYTKKESKRKYKLGIEYTYSMAKVDFITYILEQEIEKAPLDSWFSMGIIGSSSIDDDYRFWLMAKMNFQYQKVSDTNNNKDYYTIKGIYETSNIIMNLGFKYYMLLSKLKPYIFTGISIGGIINENYSIESEDDDMIISGYEEDCFLVSGVMASFGVDYMVNEKIWLGTSLNYNYNAVKLKSSTRGFAISLCTGIKF